MVKGSVASIETMGLADGPGIRTVVFLNGCKLRCKYCHNPEMQKMSDLNITSIELCEKIIRNKPYFKRNNGGVTFSGGDPLDNPESALEIAKLVKEKYNLNLWIYTGYTFEEILEKSKNNKIYLDIFSLTDVLVDGPFVNNLRDLSLLYRGSTNQRIIDVKQSLKTNSIVTLNY